MKNIRGILLILLLMSSMCSCLAQEKTVGKIINQVNFSNVKINDSFWSPRLEKHVSATLPVCIDQIETQTGRIQNFENAAKRQGKHSGRRVMILQSRIFLKK